MWAPGTFAAVADVFLILFLFLRPKLIRQQYAAHFAVRRELAGRLP
jgi:hypothetical protein